MATALLSTVVGVNPSDTIRGILTSKWTWLFVGASAVVVFNGGKLYSIVYNSTLGKIFGGDTWTDPKTGKTYYRPYLATVTDFARHPIDSAVGLFTFQIPLSLFNNKTFDARKKILGCDDKHTWTFKFWDSSIFCKGRARLGLL